MPKEEKKPTNGKSSEARQASCGNCGSNAVHTAGSASGPVLICRDCGRAS